MPSRRIVRFIARGAIVLPLFAFGHGTDMLDARFEFDATRAVRLQITADYSGNPMLTTEAEARAALLDALRVEFNGAVHPLTELAPMDMARTDQPDAESPMPRAPVDPSLKHELLRATWQWQPTSPGLRFVVPAESNQTTLFWMHEPEREKVRWMMLLGGDVTPWIAVPVAAAITHGWAALLWAVAGVFAAELLPGRRWETGR